MIKYALINEYMYVLYRDSRCNERDLVSVKEGW